jgi:hypothetical protein
MSETIRILPEKLKTFMDLGEINSRLGSARESGEFIQFQDSLVQSGMSGTRISNI